MVGSEDYRTPDSEAEQFYAALKLKGVPTTFVKLLDASHGENRRAPQPVCGQGSGNYRLVRQVSGEASYYGSRKLTLTCAGPVDITPGCQEARQR